MKYIFEEITETKSIFLLIEEHFSDEVEQSRIKNIVKDVIHHKLMDLVLDELDLEKQMIFLTQIDHEESHQNLLDKLRNWVDDFEEKIRARSKDAEAEMLALLFEGS